MAILERANWGGANMGVVRSDHFWQLGSIASLVTETTGGEILVAFWPKHGLRSDLRMPNFTNFSWGSMPPDPPSLFTFKVGQPTFTHLRIMWTDGWVMSKCTQDSQKVCTKLLSVPDNAKKLNF